MPNLVITKPSPEEYAPYYQKYIDLVKEEDILKVLSEQKAELALFFNGISNEKGNFRYAPDKWSIKEIFGHLLEGERVFAFRALFFARQPNVQLPGYDHDVWVKAGNFDNFTLEDLLREFEIVRKANLLLFRRLSQQDWMNSGIANNYNISVRSIAYVMAGHVNHHINVIKERYLAEEE